MCVVKYGHQLSLDDAASEPFDGNAGEKLLVKIGERYEQRMIDSRLRHKCRGVSSVHHCGQLRA